MCSTHDHCCGTPLFLPSLYLPPPHSEYFAPTLFFLPPSNSATTPLPRHHVAAALFLLLPLAGPRLEAPMSRRMSPSSEKARKSSEAELPPHLPLTRLPAAVSLWLTVPACTCQGGEGGRGGLTSPAKANSSWGSELSDREYH